MKIRFSILSIIFVLLVSLFSFNLPTVQATSTLTLADDSAFININALSVAQIQDILKDNKSFLKNFSENGRSAAQIIYDAAHGYGDASGKVNGIKITNTVSPAAILATLQKEQSLITMKNQHDGALNAAMGYGCPDGGGCNANYRGFTKQVEFGAWQLRYNYERASGEGFSNYQVGQKMQFDGTKIKIGNRATAALLRYTPHINTNFTHYFGKWGGGSSAVSTEGTYYAKLDKVKPKLKTPIRVSAGAQFTVYAKFENKGTATWSNSGDNPVMLGTQDPQDRPSVFLNGGNRIEMRSATVAKKKDGVFAFTMTAPNEPGTYTEKFKLVAENKTWFSGPELALQIIVQ